MLKLSKLEIKVAELEAEIQLLRYIYRYSC